MLTLPEVAKLLRVHESTIYRLLRRRELPAFKIGRDWRFRRDSIERWMREREQKKG
jgi:excisionase family DNA binding protein